MPDLTMPGWLQGGSQPRLAAALRHSLSHLVLMACTGLMLTVLAPWNSARLPLLHRAAEFLACAAVWEVASALTVHATRRRFGTRFLSSAAGLVLAMLAASVPATAGMAGIIRLAGDRVGPLPAFYANALLLGLVLAFMRRGLRTSLRATQAATPDPPAPLPAVPSPAPAAGLDPDPAASFVRRHAPGLANGRLLALQSEDHYLRIHTGAGSALVLLRLRDAVAELGDGAGWQPHRSFWLAADAGGRPRPRGQSWQIVLDNGLCVPVSRAAVPAMRRAGYASAA